MATKKKIDKPDRDELAEIIHESLNKTAGDKVAFFLDGYDETPIDLENFVSTSSTDLDLKISNRAYGGLAYGKIVSFSGLEGSGKSLLAAHVLANTQKDGGIGVLIDTESALNPDFFNAIGLDYKKLVYVNENCIENIFEFIENIIEKVRASDKDTPVTIVFDSVAGASPRSELEGSHEKEGYNTDKSIILSRSLRKLTRLIATERILLILTNQLRMKMNASPFSDPYVEPGGKSIQFHSSVSLRLKTRSKIKNSNKDVVGIQIQAKIIKNRLGPPHRVANFDIYFDRGIDDYGAWLELMKNHKMVKGGGGGWYTFIGEDGKPALDEDGNEIKFRSTEFEAFLDEDPERKEKIYERICENEIMSYRTSSTEEYEKEDVSDE